MSRKKSTVLILGTGHCGSTLVDLVLGSHSQIISLGELVNLNNSSIKGKEDFWDEALISRIKEHFRYKRNRIISYDFHKFPGSRIFENRVNLYNYIFEKNESKLLVDSSKNIFWVKRSVSHLKDSPLQPILLYIKRNPKAVINSYHRKYKGEKSFLSIVESIKSRYERNNQYFDSVFGVKKVILNYEDFCLNTEAEVKNLCLFLGIDFQYGMLKYWEHKHFNLSGNSGTNSLIKKFQEEKVQINNERQDLPYYQDHPLAIRLDERWKNELTTEQVEIIDRLIPTY